MDVVPVFDTSVAFLLMILMVYLLVVWLLLLLLLMVCVSTTSSMLGWLPEIGGGVHVDEDRGWTGFGLAFWRLFTVYEGG